MKKVLFLILILIAGISVNAQTNYQRDSMAQNSNWQQRIRISSIGAAKDILAAQGQVTYLINYCQLIVSYPFGEGGWLNAMSYAVASSPAITLEATDSDIQFTVNANIDKYAKAYYKITE
jgi:hypothetical protein